MRVNCQNYHSHFSCCQIIYCRYNECYTLCLCCGSKWMQLYINTSIVNWVNFFPTKKKCLCILKTTQRNHNSRKLHIYIGKTHRSIFRLSGFKFELQGVKLEWFSLLFPLMCQKKKNKTVSIAHDNERLQACSTIFRNNLYQVSCINISNQ